MREMKWCDIKKEKPYDGQKVIILVDGEDIQVAKFMQGREQFIVESSGYIEFADQNGNNLVPYAFRADSGPMTWFGQEVTHWMELPKLPLGDAQRSNESAQRI